MTTGSKPIEGMTEQPGASGLSQAEQSAIRALQRLAKRWPQSLMLFSASGSLCVMPNGHAGDDARDGGRDQSKVIVTILGIPNDGGDW